MTNDEVIAMVKAGLDSGTVIAKITRSGRSGFDTSVDALITLKKAGVSKEVIEAMLGSGPAATVGSTADISSASDVQLITAEGVIDLQSLQGEGSATDIGIEVLRWFDLGGPITGSRTKDPNVVIRVRSAQKPDGRLYVVRLDSNDQDRSVKMGRSRAFSATAGTTPDPEWTFPYTSVQEQDGIWKLTLTKSLPKGEYGVLRGSELFAFSVE